MKKQAKYILSMAFLCSCLMIVSCKKKEPTPPPVQSTGGNVAEEGGASTVFRHHLFEYVLNDIVNMGALVSESGSLGIYNSVSTCATVSIVNSTITIDYGYSNCTCKDGKVRKGKLVYDFSSSTNNAFSFKMPGFDLNVSTDFYVVDGWYLSIIKKRITNTSPLSIIGQTVYTGSDLQWSDSSSVIIVANSLTYADTLTGARTIKLINSNDTACYKGQGTPMKWGMARILLNGSSSGSMENIMIHVNKPFISNVNSVIRDFKCSPEGILNNYNPFISGNVYLTSDLSKTWSVDYGTGACDPDCVYTEH